MPRKMFLMLTLIVPLVAAAEDGKRVALIIGNDAYSASPLRNAVSDARTMDKALRSAGYQTTLLENAGKEKMDDTIAAFADSLGPDHDALFYYAGHAFQLENENFLVPVDYKTARGITQAKSRCVSVAQMFEELRRARARTRIVILDACRANPIAQTYSLASGLAQPLNAGKDTYIAFSTGPNQVAGDNPDGNNSWFTEALADLISQTTLNLDIDEVFNRVRKRVQTETEGKQTPWSQSSLTSAFTFRPRSTVEAENDPTLVERWWQEAAGREQREEWAEAIELLNRVLRRQTGGAMEAAAKERMPYLVARRDAQARFDGANYAGAAELYTEAFRLDPFSSGAGFQAAGSYLLADRMPDAVRLLQSVRLRGSSEAIRKSDAMLKELAAVSGEAAKELQAGAPAPPKAEELFPRIAFGVPDWEGGRKAVRSAPPEMTRWVNELAASAVPPPALTVPVVAASAATTPAQPANPAEAQAAPAAQPAVAAVEIPLHVDVVTLGATRELDYAPAADNQPPARRPPAPQTRPRPAPAVPEPQAAYGYVQFEGPVNDLPLRVNGKPVEQVAPGKLKLPVGSYEIRAVRGEDVVHRQSVEVKAEGVTKVAVKK